MAGRLLAISDLHVGYPENRAYADALAPADPADWLIVAGDVGEVFGDVGFVLASLTRRFAKVIWTPGNHELWTLPSDPVALRGVARYAALVKTCQRFGVLTPEDDFPVWDGPGGPVTVAPLFTLYDYSFRPDSPVTSAPAAAAPGAAGQAADPVAVVLAAIDQAVPADTTPADTTPANTTPADTTPADTTPADTRLADTRLADGGQAGGRQAAVAAARQAGISPADEGRLHADPYPSVAAWCRDRVAVSERRLAAVDGPVVLVSHWPLLRAPVAALRRQAFAPWCGTTLTAGWHRRHGVLAAVYGHLHIPRTTHIDGVRFEEVSVGYPREWRRRGTAPPPPRVILGD